MIQSREAATVLARQSVRLPGDPASASAARRAVREVLRAAGRTEWLHAAELASTEVVSNAVLHAHTEVELTVEVFDDVVRVQVRDFSPLLPVQRDYSAQATTGRGMALVAALTTEHGVTDVGPTGKTVWFTVGRTAVEQSDEELVAAWDDADWDLAELMRGSTASGPGAVRTVRLLGLPPLLWLAAREHHDALLRELVLHLAEHGDVASEVDVPATDRARAQVSTAVVEALEEARRAGTASRALPAGHPSPLPDVPGALDLELQLPTDVGRAFTAMQDTLDAAEELAGAGQLLVRPALPEIIAVRDWVCDQVTAQLAGVGTSSPTGTSRSCATRPDASWRPTTPTASSRSALRSPTPWAGRPTTSSGAAWSRSSRPGCARRTSPASRGT